MKQTFHRVLSALLILAMLLSNLVLLSFAAQRNTGKRHELCEELSDQAVAYYEANGFDYDTYVSYEGEISGSCLKAVNSELFKALQELMTKTMTKSVSYNSLTSYWKDTDCSNNSNNAVLFYSDQVSGSYNREHVWPKSRASFLQQDGGCDLHHLRPTNSSVNTARLNYMFGNVRELLSGYDTKDYGGNTVLWFKGDYTESTPEESKCGEDLGMVEVNDNIKGDVARVLLYVYVRWGEKNLFENDPDAKIGPNDNKNNGLRVMNDLDTLLQWCEEDPVDTWEMSRNDATQSVQGNRNIFIDYPEFAWLLFGRKAAIVDPAVCEHLNVTWHPEVPAGCYEEGVKAYYNCDDCASLTLDGSFEDEVKRTDLILPAAGHVWGQGTVVLEPTTTMSGMMSYTCTRCGAAKTAVIPKICDGGEDCPSDPFTDAPAAGHWAHEGIDYAVENQLFKGITETTFAPDRSMNRAMLVTVLWRYLDEPKEGENAFTDVKDGVWYSDAVAWAAHQGIVNGVGKGSFAPDRVITREQIAAILYRFANYMGCDTDSKQELSSFPDAQQVGSYATEAMQWAVAEGLINGIKSQGVSYLRPQGEATRAQVATILMRFLESLEA